jgi:hypothetical protein
MPAIAGFLAGIFRSFAIRTAIVTAFGRHASTAVVSALLIFGLSHKNIAFA